VIPSKEIPFLARLPNNFEQLLPNSVFFGFLRMTQTTKFGYLDDPNNQITEYSNQILSSKKLASFAQSQIQLIHALVNLFVDPFGTLLVILPKIS
jgi:hypothetical protein